MGLDGGGGTEKEIERENKTDRERDRQRDRERYMKMLCVPMTKIPYSIVTRRPMGRVASHWYTDISSNCSSRDRGRGECWNSCNTAHVCNYNRKLISM